MIGGRKQKNFSWAGEWKFKTFYFQLLGEEKRKNIISTIVLGEKIKKTTFTTVFFGGGENFHFIHYRFFFWGGGGRWGGKEKKNYILSQKLDGSEWFLKKILPEKR